MQEGKTGRGRSCGRERGPGKFTEGPWVLTGRKGKRSKPKGPGTRQILLLEGLRMPEC